MTIVYAIAVLGVLAIVFGLILAVAAKVFEVEVDPRLPEIQACLAGANCGGCGYPGCGGCAEALAAMRDASHYTRGRLSREAVHTLYGRSITLSASRMDKARSCHFAYFMQYGLRAKERTAAGFDAPQVGTFVHDEMAHTLRAASERGGL